MWLSGFLLLLLMLETFGDDHRECFPRINEFSTLFPRSATDFFEIGFGHCSREDALLLNKYVVLIIYSRSLTSVIQADRGSAPEVYFYANLAQFNVARKKGTSTYAYRTIANSESFFVIGKDVAMNKTSAVNFNDPRQAAFNYPGDEAAAEFRASPIVMAIVESTRANRALLKKFNVFPAGERSGKNPRARRVLIGGDSQSPTMREVETVFEQAVHVEFFVRTNDTIAGSTFLNTIWSQPKKPAGPHSRRVHMLGAANVPVNRSLSMCIVRNELIWKITPPTPGDYNKCDGEEVEELPASTFLFPWQGTRFPGNAPYDLSVPNAVQPPDNEQDDSEDNQEPATTTEPQAELPIEGPPHMNEAHPEDGSEVRLPTNRACAEKAVPSETSALLKSLDAEMKKMCSKVERLDQKTDVIVDIVAQTNDEAKKTRELAEAMACSSSRAALEAAYKHIDEYAANYVKGEQMSAQQQADLKSFNFFISSQIKQIIDKPHLRFVKSASLAESYLQCGICNKVYGNKTGQSNLNHFVEGKRIANLSNTQVWTTIRKHYTTPQHLETESNIRDGLTAKKNELQAAAKADLGSGATSKMIRSVYALNAMHMSFYQHGHLIELQLSQGVPIGHTHFSNVAASRMTLVIGQTLERQLAQYLLDNPDVIISLSLDTTTLSTSESYLLLMIRFVFLNYPSTFLLKAVLLSHGETGVALFNATRDAFDELGLLDVLKRRTIGVGTDGAAAMTGHELGFKGLFSRFVHDELEFQPFFIHCSAHRVELALSDALSRPARQPQGRARGFGSPGTIRSFLTRLINQIHVFFGPTSIRRIHDLRQVCEEEGITYYSALRVISVRWAASEHMALGNFLSMLRAYIIYFRRCEATSQEPTKTKCSSLFTILKDPKLWGHASFERDLLKTFRELSERLQQSAGTTIDLDDALDDFELKIEGLVDKGGPETAAVAGQLLCRIGEDQRRAKCIPKYLLDGTTSRGGTVLFSVRHNATNSSVVDLRDPDDPLDRGVDGLLTSATNRSRILRSQVSATDEQVEDEVEQIRQLQLLRQYKELILDFPKENFRREQVDRIEEEFAIRFPQKATFLFRWAHPRVLKAFLDNTTVYGNASQQIIRTSLQAFAAYFVFNDRTLYGQLEDLILTRVRASGTLTELLNPGTLAPERWWFGVLSEREKGDIPVGDELVRALVICLTLPPSTSDVERGHSILKYLKNERRTSLKQPSVNAALHILLNGPPISDYIPGFAAAEFLKSHVVADNPMRADERRKIKPLLADNPGAVEVMVAQSYEGITPDDDETLSKEDKFLKRYAKSFADSLHRQRQKLFLLQPPN